MSKYKVPNGVETFENVLNNKLRDHIKKNGGDPYEYYIKLRYRKSSIHEWHEWLADIYKYIYPTFDREGAPLYFIPSPNITHVCTVRAVDVVEEQRFADYICYAFDKHVKKEDDKNDKDNETNAQCKM